jgi:hypothetical protein
MARARSRQQREDDGDQADEDDRAPAAGQVRDAAERYADGVDQQAVSAGHGGSHTAVGSGDGDDVQSIDQAHLNRGDFEPTAFSAFRLPLRHRAELVGKNIAAPRAVRNSGIRINRSDTGARRYFGFVPILRR